MLVARYLTSSVNEVVLALSLLKDRLDEVHELAMPLASSCDQRLEPLFSCRKTETFLQMLAGEVAPREVEKAEGSLKIRTRKQIANHCVSFRVRHIQQERCALDLFDRQRFPEKGVNRKVGFVILVL